MIFDILEKKITDAGLAVAGESLFRSFMPAEVSVGVMIRVPLEGLPVDQHMPGRYSGRIQVIVRHTDPVTGSALAQKISDILLVRSFEEYAASSERGYASISIFVPETLPIQFPRLSGGGIEFSQHFRAVFSFDQLAS